MDITSQASHATRHGRTPKKLVATWKSIDVLDPESATAAIGGLDVLVSAYGPGNAGQDFDDTMRRSIDDPSTFARVATTLLKGLDEHPSIRLIVIGGTGSLEISPGVVMADQTQHMRADLEKIGLPGDYIVAVEGHRAALNTYIASPTGSGPISARRSMPSPANAQAASGSVGTNCSPTRTARAASRSKTSQSQ